MRRKKITAAPRPKVPPCIECGGGMHHTDTGSVCWSCRRLAPIIARTSDSWAADGGANHRNPKEE